MVSLRGRRGDLARRVANASTSLMNTVMSRTRHGHIVFRPVFRLQRLIRRLPSARMGAYHAPLMRHHAPRLMRHHAPFPIVAWCPPSRFLSRCTARSSPEHIQARPVLSRTRLDPSGLSRTLIVLRYIGIPVYRAIVLIVLCASLRFSIVLSGSATFHVPGFLSQYVHSGSSCTHI